MVAPVTSTALPTNDSHSGYSDGRKWEQSRPIDRPLPYRRNVFNRTFLSGAPDVFGSFSVLLNNGVVPEPFNQTAAWDHLVEKARNRLRGEIGGDNALWGANIAEYQQALLMMTERLHQIGGLLKSLIKGDFLTFSAVLTNAGNPLKKGKFATGRSLADTWLEFSFGWKPLVQDVFNSVDILQTPIKALKAKGTASETWFKTISSGTGPTLSKDEALGRMFCKMGCEVEIENPNLWLANQLGLVNPALVVWELIPFSFVVDWFTNVGQFLGQGTDFYGLSVKRPYSTVAAKGTVQQVRNNPWLAPPTNVRNATYAVMYRTDSLLGVSLSFRPARLWGWQRCANAASVVTQLLTKVGR